MRYKLPLPPALSIYPAVDAYMIAGGSGSDNSFRWAMLAFLFSIVLIAGILLIDEVIRELRALRITYERLLQSN